MPFLGDAIKRNIGCHGYKQKFGQCSEILKVSKRVIQEKWLSKSRTQKPRKTLGVTATFQVNFSKHTKFENSTVDSEKC